MAIDVTSAGTPREKLLWAFRFNFQNFIPVIFVEDLGFEKLICIEQNSKGMPSTNLVDNETVLSANLFHVKDNRLSCLECTMWTGMVLLTRMK